MKCRFSTRLPSAPRRLNPAGAYQHSRLKPPLKSPRASVSANGTSTVKFKLPTWTEFLDFHFPTAAGRNEAERIFTPLISNCLNHAVLRRAALRPEKRKKNCKHSIDTIKGLLTELLAYSRLYYKIWPVMNERYSEYGQMYLVHAREVYPTSPMEPLNRLADFYFLTFHHPFNGEITWRNYLDANYWLNCRVKRPTARIFAEVEVKSTPNGERGYKSSAHQIAHRRTTYWQNGGGILCPRLYGEEKFVPVFVRSGLPCLWHIGLNHADDARQRRNHLDISLDVKVDDILSHARAIVHEAIMSFSTSTANVT